MAIYTVHQPPPRAGETATDPDRFVFLRDGFSFWAFLLTPLWMVRHRLWLALLVYAIVTVALQVGLRSVGASSMIMLAVGTLVALLVGFEAATLRRLALARRRWKSLGIVVGDDLEAAERRFFDIWVKDAGLDGGWPSSSAQRAAAMPAIMRTGTSGREVIGLFPHPGATR
jgi:hypothetical protein